MPSDKPILVINQPFGLGDIIYIQALVSELSNDRHIVFPISDEFFWLSSYIENPDVTYVKRSEYNIDYDRFDRSDDYLPLRYATQHLYGLGPTDYSHDHTVMTDKYNLMGIDPKKWIDFKFNYQAQKEDDLFRHLGLEEDMVYTVVNGNGGSDSVGRVRRDIPVDSDHVIQMSFIEGFSLLDWRKVLSRCQEFHTISTSVVYLVDQWCSPECRLFCYERNNNPDTLNSIKPILTKNWNYVYNL